MRCPGCQLQFSVAVTGYVEGLAFRGIAVLSPNALAISIQSLLCRPLSQQDDRETGRSSVIPRLVV